MAKSSAKSAKATKKKAPSAAQLAAREKFKAMVAAKKKGGSSKPKASKSTKKKTRKATKSTKSASAMVRNPSLTPKPIGNVAYDNDPAAEPRVKPKVRKYREVLDTRSAFGTVWI